MGFTSKSVAFGGTDEYVNMGNVLDFARTDTFSISFWIRLPPAAVAYYAFSKMAGGPQGWDIFVNASPGSGSLGLELSNANPGPHITVSAATPTLSDGNWHHIVCTWNGDASPGAAGVRLYFDGALCTMVINSDTLGVNSINNSANLVMGQLLSTGWLVGSLDEVSVYKKTLSATEVTWIYNGKEPRDLLAAGSPSNLVAWWRMGDGDVFNTLLDSGPSVIYPTVKDNSGNAYSGTMTSMAATDIVSDTPGKSVPSMKSALFGGTDEYATCGNILAFERTDSFSISCWFKTTDTTGGYMVGKMAGATTYRGYAVGWQGSGALHCLVRSDNATTNRIYVLTTATGWNDGQWHHVVWTYAGTSLASGITCTIDGVLQPLSTVTDALSATIVDTSSFWLGGASTVAAGFLLVGNLDEVAVYNKVLNAAEKAWVFNNGTPRLLTDSGCPSNLVGWWKMGDGDTFPTLLDSSGSGFSGTMTNMESTDLVYDSPINGVFARRSLRLDGINKYVTMGDVLDFDRLNPFSASVWVRTTNAASQFVLAKGGVGAPEGWWILMRADGKPVFALMNTYLTSDLRVRGNTGALNDGLWHHIGVVHSGTGTAAGVRIFADGVEVTTTVESDNLTTTTVNAASLRIGTRENGYPAECFAGNIDEVSLYNRALSSVEMAWIYNSGVPRDLKASEAPKMLVAWWRLGESAYPGTMQNMEITDITNNTVYSNAAPVLDYSWRFKNNISLATTGTRIGDFRQLLLAMKNALKTASGWTDSTGTAATLSTPWTVVASSNGTDGGTGLGDNWTVPGDLVWANAGTAHSWIVLRQTGINGLNVEICIDLNITSTDYQISLVDSYGAGFDVSSPSKLNRPTASDQSVRYSANTWTGLTTAFSGYLNVAVSNGGECTRLFLFTTATCRFFWIYDRPKNPVSGWTTPVGSALIGVGNEPTYVTLNDAVCMVTRVSGRNVALYWTTEFYVDGAIGQRQITVSDVTAEWPITRIGLACVSAGLAGRHGELSDIWFGDVTLVNGDTYPAVAPLKQFIQVGDIVLPWDRSVPVTT